MYEKGTYELLGNLFKKYSKRIGITIITVLLWCVYLCTAAYANSAGRPSLTVIVSNPPEDLSISLEVPDEQLEEALVLEAERKGWETYYRFFYHMSQLQINDMKRAVLVIQSSEKSFQCPLPASAMESYNNLLTLDMETETITMGQHPFRVPALVAMRVVLTLLIEGIVFLLFGYRKKRSWIVFFVVNIITQAGVNAMLTGPILSTYWILGYIFIEIIVFIVEIIAFACLIKEFRKRRAVLYAIVANAASLVLGGYLINYLPV